MLFIQLSNENLLVCTARYPAKFMKECRSLWHNNYILIKQKDNYSVIKKPLSPIKSCRTSCCTSVCSKFLDVETTERIFHFILFEWHFYFHDDDIIILSISIFFLCLFIDFKICMFFTFRFHFIPFSRCVRISVIFREQ